MLHLAWHHKLKHDEPPDAFLWIDPAIHPSRLVQVAALCRRVWRAHEKGGIPYAFDVPSECFDYRSGQILLGETRRGLTCATFVAAVFMSAGINLLAVDTWPANRQEDVTWHGEIIELLEKTGAAKEHVEELRNQVGCSRFRPEEVAAAATLEAHPVAFGIAQRLGEQIVSMLNNRGGRASE